MSPSPLAIRFADAELEASVRGGLDAVEAALERAVRSGDEFVAGAARHLMDAGGKRFRPLVCLLAAHLGDPSRPELVPAAVVVELTHLATLYHDDVMDEASVRARCRVGEQPLGQHRSRSSPETSSSPAPQICSPTSARTRCDSRPRTFGRLVTGQIRETVGPRDGADPIEHYLAVLADKTGSLIATSAEFGGYFAGLDEVTVERLRIFGEQIGVAFQLSDDILDIASESTESGKTPGTDLREGIPTLPVLYALRESGPDGVRLRELVSRPLADDAEHAEALTLLRSSSALAEARATLAAYSERARWAADRPA